MSGARASIEVRTVVSWYLCSAFIVVPHTQGAQVRITQCYLQITPNLSLRRKHSPDGASPDWCCGHLIVAASLLLIYLPRKDKRLSRPGWLTYSGQFTHISGYPSAAGRAQYTAKVRQSRPMFYHCATQPSNKCVDAEWRWLKTCWQDCY